MTTIATSELRSTEFSTKAGNLIKSLDSAINFESNNLGKISTAMQVLIMHTVLVQIKQWWKRQITFGTTALFRNSYKGLNGDPSDTNLKRKIHFRANTMLIEGKYVIVRQIQ